MSQIFSQIPRQLLQQQQRLTPQLIQAMDILQLNTLALESRIAQELDANPALELLPDEEEVVAPLEAETARPDQRPEEEQALVVQEGAPIEFERLDNLVREYDWLDDENQYRGTKSAARGLEEADSKQDAMANTAARPISLNEYLLQQWHLVEVDERTRLAGAAIIDAIDETGRLATPLEQIAQELTGTPLPAREGLGEGSGPGDAIGGAAVDRPEAGQDVGRAAPALQTPRVEELEAALAAVQQLDPPGIAARSLQECLLLQLTALPGENGLARRIIREHFEDLQKNRLPAIAKALDVSVDEVKVAIQVISHLSLHPGTEVVERRTPALVPDLIVEYNEQDGRYDVRLSRGNARELRLSPEFRELLERSKNDAKTREFVKQKIEAASAIIDAVRYRRERLLDVGWAVVEAQHDFLDQGEQHLKVLRMSDLAARFGCDPSTISRTVDEKYLQTPRGIFPLRRFFTGGAETDDGEALGWASIKAKVQEIVANEDKANPLSDDAIVEKLKAEGVEIKRRTVAKYRAQLGIPPARQRRQY